MFYERGHPTKSVGLLCATKLSLQVFNIVAYLGLDSTDYAGTIMCKLIHTFGDN